MQKPLLMSIKKRFEQPEWGEIKVCDEGVNLTDKEKRDQTNRAYKMVMTRGKDDLKTCIIYWVRDRKKLDRQFKMKIQFQNSYCGRHVANQVLMFHFRHYVY
jgi:hypothetical protein